MAPDPLPDRRQLAERVHRRRLELDLSINAAARLGSMSPITWSRVESGKSVRELTYAGVDRALNWETGTAERLLRGGDPAVSHDERPATPSGPPVRYPDDPVLQHLWNTPDDALSDDQRHALVQLYLALKRTSSRPRSPAESGQARPLRHAR
jgi:transcriptional regulator with XRE-family HTH domain